MLKQRVITAVALLALLVGSLAWSPLAFEVLATAIIAAALGEWLQLVGWPRVAALAGAVAFGAALLAVALAAPQLVERALIPLALLAAILWAVVALVLVQQNAVALRVPRAAATALAVVMTAAAWAALVHLLLAGVAVLLSVLVIVWVADTAAYFAGRAFGKRKLAPHISPGKTWAGVVGAVVAVVVLAVVARQIAPQAPLLSNRLLAEFGIPAAALLGLLVIVSIVGDLFESLLKRQAGVKDSSRLLPGHGGVYDRIDALLPVLPTAALLERIAQ